MNFTMTKETYLSFRSVQQHDYYHLNHLAAFDHKESFHQSGLATGYLFCHTVHTSSHEVEPKMDEKFYIFKRLHEM